MTSIIKTRRIYELPSTGGGGSPADSARITVLENNENKVAYFEPVSSSAGTITIPAQATILLDQLAGGVDAYVSTIENGTITGQNPVTAGGVIVDVTSFDALGNYTLSGTPSSYPVGIIYILKIKEIYWSNLTTFNIIDAEASFNKAETTTELNINGNSYNLSADREWRVAQADTGALTFAGFSSATGTTVTIGAVTGYVVDNETTSSNPAYTYVNYAGEVGKTVTTIGSGTVTYVLLNSSGVIIFQNTFPTSAQRKTNIWLGKLAHPNLTSLSGAQNEPDFITSPLAQHRGLFQALGPYINNGVITSPNGANLTINVSSGTIYGDGINFVVDKTKPDEIAVGPLTPMTFLPRTQTGAGGTAISIVDVGNYDVAGTVTAIPGGGANSTLRYIYYSPQLGFLIQYGQTFYTSLNNAIVAVGNEVQVLYPPLVNNSILIAILAVSKSATSLLDTTKARFFLTDKFGQLGSASASVTSTTTMQQAYNNSTTPEIVTNSTGAALSLKRGSAADTDDVFEILNGAGTETFAVTGEGDINSTQLDFLMVNTLKQLYNY